MFLLWFWGLQQICQYLQICLLSDENSPFIRGVLKWKGILPEREELGILAGIETDQPIGRSGNGEYKGNRYFTVISMYINSTYWMYVL